jgi:hypothetical protein
MAEIPGFWDVGPHDPLPVEATWDEFVSSAGGQRISDIISKSPEFDNADYLFQDFKLREPRGILAFVNDGFTGLAPDIVHALACD